MAAIVERLTRRQNRSTLIAAFAVTAFVVFFANEFWREGQTVSSSVIVRFVVIGIVYASIYGIAAAGLVVTYTTSGIFNFAQGAMGMFFAFVYWQMKADPESGGWGIPSVPSLIIVIFIIAPIIGAAIERLVMRGLADAPLVAKLVATIGLLAFFIGLTDIIWSGSTYRTIGTFFSPTSGFSIPSLASSTQPDETFVQWYRFITVLIGIGIALVLRAVFYRTRIGVAMRAVVDNRELAALNGAKPGQVSMFAWAIGASMAAIAGILLAQAYGNFDSQVLTLFIIEAFAAAIIGRLRSLPMTLVGGAVIGFSVSFKETFLAFPDRWLPIGRQGVIPGIILFLALLFLPQARIEGRKLAKAVTARVPSMKVAGIGFAIFFIVVVVLCAITSDSNLIHIEAGVVIAFIMLSLVPLTGWAGHISFAQVTFAGVGAWAGFEFSSAGGNMFGLDLYPEGSPLALLMALLIAIPIGLLMALPALRLSGLYLALASMAFALMGVVFFDQPEVYSNTGRRIENIKIGGYSFGKPFEFLGITFGQGAAFTMFAALLFGVVGMGVVALRRGIIGRRLIAMRDSEAACATLGVNTRATKLMVFGLSAGIAGMGGMLFGIHSGNVETGTWHLLSGLDGAGLALLLLMVVGGVSVVSGAVFGAATLQIFTKFLPLVWAKDVKIVQYWSKVGPGLAGVGIARQPEGVVPQVGHDLREKKRLKRAAASSSDEDT